MLKTRKCKICGIEIEWKRTNVMCREHYNEYMRKLMRRVTRSKEVWTKAVAKYIKKYPEREKARILAKKAVLVGEVIQFACEKCGNFISQGHHEDYTKPLELTWLCRKHHNDRHKEIRNLKS